MARTIWTATAAVAFLTIAAGQVAQAQNDCHANLQTHFVQGLGWIAHSHAQNCDVVVPQGGSPVGAAHCHSNVQVHSPGWHAGGNTPHAHSGWNCGYQTAPSGPGVSIQVPGFGFQLNAPD